MYTTINNLQELENLLGSNNANNITILHLKLENRLFSSDFFSRLVEILKVNRSITSLSLSWNNIGHQGAKDIADSLKVNTYIASLDLPRNKIGDEGAKDIAEVLKVNKSIISLDLSWSNIGYEGAKDIAEALEVNTSITSLNLSWSNIGPQGAKDIADSLKVNTSIRSLNLSWNKIGPQGAKDIAEVLKVNRSITSLNLSWNKIGDEGAKDITEALKVNTSITSLNLSDHNIGDEGAKDIAEVLKVNRSITSLNLYWHKIGHEEAKDIIDSLKSNKAFLYQTIEKFIRGEDLDIQEVRTIKAHLIHGAHLYEETSKRLEEVPNINSILEDRESYLNHLQLQFLKKVEEIEKISDDMKDSRNDLVKQKFDKYICPISMIFLKGEANDLGLENPPKHFFDPASIHEIMQKPNKVCPLTRKPIKAKDIKIVNVQTLPEYQDLVNEVWDSIHSKDSNEKIICDLQHELVDLNIKVTGDSHEALDLNG